jgi:hypothetical protein
MTCLQRNHVSIGISLILHMAIMGILTLFILEPEPSLHWYEIEFRDPLAQNEVEKIAGIGRENLSPPANERSAAKGVIPGIAAPEQETKPGSDTDQSNVISAPSELIETPRLGEEEEQPGQVDLGDNALAQGALRGVIGGDDPEGASISYKVTGGRVRFTLPADYKHSLGASGSVTLQFKLDEYARPITNSIVPLQQSGPRFFQAAKKALQDGSFSFIGAPEPGVTCQITMEFL